MSVSNFIQYHNAIPIALGVIFLGAGATFAATNPEAVYSSKQTIVSIDNTYIANKDLSLYTPRVEIVGVTEDPDFYYVAYRFSTIDLQDSIWKDVTKAETMKVSKSDLGPYRDLGLYVTEQLKQIVDRETQRLATTQEIEQKNVTQKTVATVYGGLIGKILDNTTEELPGYTPVVTPPPPPAVAAAAVADPAPPATPQQSPVTPPAPQGNSGAAPALQILGDNPARVAVGSAYVDLGASITGPTEQDLGLGIGVALNGVAVTVVRVDTSRVGEWTIRYSASNASGASFVERSIMVYEPPPVEVLPEAPPTDAPDPPTEIPTAENPPAVNPPAPESPPVETPPVAEQVPTPEVPPAESPQP